MFSVKIQFYAIMVTGINFTGMVSPSMHKGRGGALNGDTKNSWEGDHTSSLHVATPSPQQRGEALSGGGCGYTWASLS